MKEDTCFVYINDLSFGIAVKQRWHIFQGGFFASIKANEHYSSHINETKIYQKARPLFPSFGNFF
jgi:hypothetical protein